MPVGKTTGTNKYMAKDDYRRKWQEAYAKAGFYRMDQNTRAYWDRAAESDGGGLAGKKHIECLKEYLIANHLISDQSTILDIGCGSGDYVREFAAICGHVTALDYSEKMLEACKERCLKDGADNVSYILADFMGYDFTEKYGCILACLNPVTYQPDALDKMLELSAGLVIYFSMDTPIEGADKEPVYCGCNSVRFAEQYLRERGIYYRMLPYTYEYTINDGTVREIPFAYLVIIKENIDDVTLVTADQMPKR
ncbi:MAG: class I SAM-dependent methyltransferase [Lachnospiraceae bacterium]|nr:class I SAM-dependent methyltransferase [Lachnospiraceae bacterium]